MSPRRSAAAAARTRADLLGRAAALASTDGLEGVTIGRLAAAASLSKSGVVRHFPTKEALQLQTLERGFAIFAADVWEPVAHLPAGSVRLDALLERWTAYLAGDTFPGGCLLSQVAAEFDARPGPVRDASATGLRRWLTTLEREAAAAGHPDPAAVAFELNALGVGANQARQLLGDDGAPARALAAMRARLAGM